MNVLQVPAQYLATVVDFLLLKRPKGFYAAIEDDSQRYFHPYLFLVTNVVLAAVVLEIVHRSTVEARVEGISRTVAVVIFSCIAFFHCLVVLGFGKTAGFLLNENTEVTRLWTAFCFTSVFYPIMAPLVAHITEHPATNRRPEIFWAILAIQALALGFLLSSMARASFLHGRRLLAFVSVAGAAVALFLVIASVVVAIVPFHESGPHEFTLAPNEKLWPVSAITLQAISVTPQSALLIGATVGDETAERFEYGTTRRMKGSITAHGGLAAIENLTPNTKYYFRYVAEYGKITCFGEIRSFTTDSV